MSTYIIAELGACADGKLERMLEGVKVAADRGVNALKLQWVSDPHMMTKRRGRAEVDGYDEIYARYLSWPASWHEAVYIACRAHGIDYMCSCYLKEDISVVALYVSRFKIASFEAGDSEFLWAHKDYKKPVVISVGMTDVIPEAVADFARSWVDTQILHCVSAYPAPIESLNLSVIDPLVYDGFSDHSDPALTWTGALAVAAGAKIVEAHLRLDSTDPKNPDYSHAMTALQFDAYVKHIRFSERCMGDGVKRIQDAERIMMPYRVT